MSVFSRSFYYGKYLPHRPHPEPRCTATSPISLDSTTDTTSKSPMHVHVTASGVTDPGRVGKQNQDAFFLIHDTTNAAMVLGVFDGHGRETGKDAAMTAKGFFEAHFRAFTAAQYEELEANPHAVFTQLFRSCHEMIKSVFRGIYEQRGYKVQDIDGSLVRKDHEDDDDDEGVCIRGGTCATIAVLLHGGRKILTANVGDSAVLLGSSEPMLSPNDVHTRSHARAMAIHKPKTTPDGLTLRFRDEIKKQAIVLTGDHSADSESEFLRVRRHSLGSPEAQVQFVYDCSQHSPSCSRSTSKKRLPVFNVSPRGLIHQNMIGDYYKNVRDEWATIVTTPQEAPYPDSLAFTRSLGDFHMHTYGVCDEPSVHEISLDTVFARHVPSKRTSPTSIDSIAESSDISDDDEKVGFFLVVASDGVWDNWKYDELIHFLVEHNNQGMPEPHESHHSLRFWAMHPDHTNDTSHEDHTHHQSHIDRLTTELMEANIHRADRIFGDQVDNMTAIVCRLECNLA